MAGKAKNGKVKQLQDQHIVQAPCVKNEGYLPLFSSILYHTTN